jgi:S1-C subfamily serine protease
MVTGVMPDSDPARRGVVAGDVILRVAGSAVATPPEVQSGVDAARAGKRDFVALLILPKVREQPGPKWVALQVSADGG